MTGGGEEARDPAAGPQDSGQERLGPDLGLSSSGPPALRGWSCLCARGTGWRGDVRMREGALGLRGEPLSLELGFASSSVTSAGNVVAFVVT